jgi:hypothetical protein
VDAEPERVGFGQLGDEPAPALAVRPLRRGHQYLPEGGMRCRADVVEVQVGGGHRLDVL